MSDLLNRQVRRGAETRSSRKLDNDALNSAPHGGAPHPAAELGLHAESRSKSIEQGHRRQLEGGPERQDQITPAEECEAEPPGTLGFAAANDADDGEAEHREGRQERGARPGLRGVTQCRQAEATTTTADIRPAIGKRTARNMRLSLRVWARCYSCFLAGISRGGLAPSAGNERGDDAAEPSREQGEKGMSAIKNGS